ncbi:hypothetical protein NE235_28970 [Actinoallomurus spadix]|uniref:Integral membrane protein n=1 Tax=Actinoallomurus spadix TaxID=79912 RepID=A0ABP3GIC3_9ACTN|nr:hypothetical protein [Actinoallomurus spadix]MCO5990154.1 hypothetical protein [Actinoallomurus spadix]
MTTTTLRASGRPHPLRLWATAATVVALASSLAVALTLLRPALPELVPGYSSWRLGYAHPAWYLYWILGDTTEATLAKSALGGLLMIGGAAFAHAARRRGARYQGFTQACGTGMWPWVALSGGLGVVASNLMWGWTLSTPGGWQPTFAPFVSVPPAVVILYGEGWLVAVTGAALGATLVTPIAVVAVNDVCVPLGLSPVVGSVLAMSLGGLIACSICMRLPWMPPLRASLTPVEPTPPAQVRHGPSWVPRRILADFTEAHFYGNEWAGAGLLLGCVLHYLLNPAAPAYGSGLLPHLLAAQILTAACGVLVWRGGHAAHGWYPTFVPVVSVAPATVLAFGGTLPAIISGAVLGALVAPPLGAALARRLPPHLPPMVAYTATMALCTATIIPLLDLLAGFRHV